MNVIVDLYRSQSQIVYLKYSNDYFRQCLFSAALSTVSAIPGALFVSYPMQYFGRRTIMMALCLPFAMGYMLMGLANAVGYKELVYIGRSITGVTYGAMLPPSQLYVNYNANLIQSIIINTSF